MVALHRYPVKSMRAESLDTAALHWTGLHGDRQYAFCRAADRLDFLWLTGGQIWAISCVNTVSASYRKTPGCGLAFPHKDRTRYIALIAISVLNLSQ